MTYTTYLRWALLGGLCLVFFVPFIIAGNGLFPWSMFFPFITGKNFVFRILIEILFGLYVLLALREPKYRPRSSLLVWALGLFTLWVGITTFTSVDGVKSFWSNFERMQGYISILHLFAYFIILGAMAEAEKWWNRILQCAVAAGTLQALYSLGQLLHVGGLSPSSQSGPRLDGTFGNAIYLAVFMLFTVFITLLMLVRERRSIASQYVYGLALVLEVAALFFTETRGALLGLVGGLTIAALYIAWRATAPEWQTLRKISFGGLGVILLLAAGAFALRNTSFVKHNSTLSRLTSISLTDPTTQSRFQIWNMALQGAKEKPVLGWGEENFSFVFNKYYNPSMYTQEQWFDRVHNQFLDWLIAGGLPALLLYISLFVLAVLAIVRSDVLLVPEQAILLGLLAGYAFNNLTVFDDLMSSVYFVFILALLHGLSRRALPGWLFLSKPLGDKVIAVAAPVVAVVTLLGVWAFNGPAMARALNLVVAITPQTETGSAKDPKTTMQQFLGALEDNVWPGSALGKQESTEQLFQYATSLAPSTSVDPSVKQDVLNFTNTAGKALLAARPHDARLELFMGVFLTAFGQGPQALAALELALTDSPTKQQIMFQLGVMYLNQGDTKSALAVLKRAFEEAPSFNDARILYALGLYYAGQGKEADALLVEAFGTVLYDDSRLVQTYTNTKQYDRVIGIWQKRIDADPKNAQAHAGLASAYFASGDKARTIQELQRAAQLDPSLAVAVQALITQINNGTLKPGQ